MILDWMFAGWMISTVALLLLILYLIHDIRKRIEGLETKSFGMTLNQYLPDHRMNLKSASYNEPVSIEAKPKRKGGWPKGKKRKSEQKHEAPI